MKAALAAFFIFGLFVFILGVFVLGLHLGKYHAIDGVSVKQFNLRSSFGPYYGRCAFDRENERAYCATIEEQKS